jgi:hypothetical protein
MHKRNDKSQETRSHPEANLIESNQSSFKEEN